MDTMLIPVQRAASNLRDELRLHTLPLESENIVASFALELLSIFDSFYGRCHDRHTADAIAHKLCASYIRNDVSLATTCGWYSYGSSALQCICDELNNGIVGVCRAHIAPHSRDVPLCHLSHEGSCHTPFSGLCVATGMKVVVPRPAKITTAHAYHGTKSKHQGFRAHAKAQKQTRWAHTAAQRIAAARPGKRATPSSHVLLPNYDVQAPPPQSVAFLFLSSSTYNMNNLATPPAISAFGSNVTICSTGPRVLAAVELVFPYTRVLHRLLSGVKGGESKAITALVDGGCTTVATWPPHAETIFTNPCVNGAMAHVECHNGAMDRRAFDAGHKIFKDPHRNSMVVNLPSLSDKLASHAEHAELHEETCRHATRAAAHHHLPHC